jgi:phosphate:Na+ symporter
VKDFQIIVAAVTSIILFVFGLENFSKEIQRISGESFRKFLASATKYSSLGILIGAVVTAFIQSSSATSIIAISLVNAGVLSFKNSVGIIFGSNIGTTVTAQLVAFKLTAFAPAFIILGFLLSFIKSKYSIFAKSLFYFGFVFFTLNLISSTLAPLQNDERLIAYLTANHSPLVGVLIGFVITALVQSSSVTTGLAIIFTQQGLMSLDNAIPVLMGANMGTTITALISILNMDIAAKKTAMAHFLFNFGGVLIFLPIVWYYGKDFPLLSDRPAIALANFHLIFNLTTSILFAILINPFTKMIDKILGEGKMDFDRFDLSYIHQKEDVPDLSIEEKLKETAHLSYGFIQENYNLVTLSIETNYKSVYEAAQKRVEYYDHVKAEIMGFFSAFMGRCHDENEISKFVKVMEVYEYIFQIHDSIKDLIKLKETMDENYIELKSDLLLIIRDLSSTTLTFFEDMSFKTEVKNDLKKKSHDYQAELNTFNKKILRIMAQKDRSDAGTMLHMITYSQRLKDKIIKLNELV